MIPQPREFQAGDRKLIIRLNLGNAVTAQRRLRPLLAAHGITNIFGPGSEALLAAAGGDNTQTTLPSLEAEAVLACACLVENEPAIGVEEYMALADAHPELGNEIQAEIADFFRRRGGPMLGVMATFRGLLMQVVANVTNLDLGKLEILLSTGPSLEPPPSSTGESVKMNSGDAPPATSSPSSPVSAPESLPISVN